MSLVCRVLSVLNCFMPRHAVTELADVLLTLATCFSQASNVKPFSMSLEELKDE
jgi:hypothetical protein